MKNAMLITAYKDFDLLLTLLKYYSPHYSCYVHVDKKIPIPKEFEDAVSGMSNVRVIQKHRINWGSYKHIMAFLSLLEMAYQDGCDYFHLIPADTFPVKPIEAANAFFEANRQKNFIEMIPVAEDEGLNLRQKYFYFQHRYNLKADAGYSTEQRLLALQKKLGISRKPKMRYKGYVYCHLSREFAGYVLEYVKKEPSYLRYVKTCSIGEEFFFQNIISQTQLECVSDHLIFDHWMPGKGGPEALSMEQIDKALHSSCMFARKVADRATADYVLGQISRSLES